MPEYIEDRTEEQRNDAAQALQVYMMQGNRHHANISSIGQFNQSTSLADEFLNEIEDLQNQK